MKTPDKIFAGYRYKNNEDEMYALRIRLTHRDTEYIKKDTLVKWIKDEQSKCSDETHPYYQFMNVVLEKINSL